MTEDTQTEKQKEVLYAPPSYWNQSARTKKIIEDSYDLSFISKKLWGLDISRICSIHKFCYHLSKTIQGKEKADRIFLNNMLRWIDEKTKNKWLVWLRRKEAIKNYKRMYYLGGPIFWKNKNTYGYMHS